MIKKKIGSVLMIAALLNLLVFAVAPLAAGERLGSETQINTTSARDQDSPAIAMNPDGDYVVCWEHWNGTDDDIQFQRYGGYPHFPHTLGPNRTAVDGDLDQDNPSIAMDESGNFVVVWEECISDPGPDSGDSEDIKAQIYDSEGTAQLPEPIVVADGADDQESPSVAMNEAGEFVVAWEVGVKIGSVTVRNIKAQRYRRSGGRVGSVIDVTADFAANRNPSVAINPTGLLNRQSFVIVYESSLDLKARLYNYDGADNELRRTITIADGHGEQETPAVAMDYFGYFVVTWEDDSGGNEDVRAQRYRPHGVVTGAEMQVTFASGHQDTASIAMDPDGSFVICWEDGAGGNNEVWAQRYNSQGACLGPDFQVNTTTDDAQGDPVVAMNRDGYCVVVWESEGQDTAGSQGVFAQRFTNLSTTWYFAEGCTGSGFEEWLTLQNPNAVEVDATITYYFRDGGTQVQPESIPAESRETIKVNDVVGAGREVSVKVVATQPIIAERPMYFNYDNKWQGGHTTIGATSTGTSWYFAEGCTGSGFEEWLTLQNPDAADVFAAITYYFRDGETEIQNMVIPAESRETIKVNDVVGTGREVSIEVNALGPIVAERPVYFNYDNKWQGGHTTIGASVPANHWYLAEGYTGEGFEEWLTLQNPSFNSVATITYYFADGGTHTDSTVIPRESRKTISINEAVGANRPVSIRIDSPEPIVLERPIYFDYGGVQGGHNSIGFGP